MCENSAASCAPNNDGLSAVAKRIGEANSLLLLCHARPDGDGLGSMLALTLAGRAAGKTMHMLVPDNIPPRELAFFGDLAVSGPKDFDSLADQVELIVVLDTCAKAQLDGVADAIEVRNSKTVIVDHHRTADSLGSSRWIDPTAAATGVMTGELIEELGWPVDLQVAEALMMAVTADTGWLRFANTDGRCLRAVAKWADLGVRTDKLYMKLHQNDRPNRLKIMARMLQGMELHCEGKLAIMTLLQKDFAETGARGDETENFVNEALRIGTVETCALLTENGSGIRVSLRSRELVDVAAVAQGFGGGGHQRAAGLRSTELLETVRKQIIDALSKALSAAS